VRFEHILSPLHSITRLKWGYRRVSITLCNWCKLRHGLCISKVP
jgi:hypothetical protein